MRTEALFIGGRSGVGKSAAAFALHDLLVARDVRHAVIEGDALDLAHPAPWEHGLAARNLAARNLAAMWANYRDLGYRRLVYANTVAAQEADALATAMGDDPRIIRVLLRARDDAADDRLGRRERGESLRRHRERSARMAVHLDATTPPGTVRLDTDRLTPEDVAAHLLALTDWT